MLEGSSEAVASPKDEKNNNTLQKTSSEITKVPEFFRFNKIVIKSYPNVSQNYLELTK